MAYDVIWTPNAARDIANVLEYVTSKQSKAVANLLFDDVMKGVDILCLFPDIGMNIAPGTDVRRIKVQENYAMTYAKIETHIVLLNIFDLRGPGNPDNRKKKRYRSSKLF
jgi:plasmid stabilization system protein ParE